ncbi:MAG TPA: FAD-binding oxidoreductase, partial [Ktedonobacteraceae bacterium]|nr:FAD-binding oxidoreductase [Ktedonobacteraceae bacterium]
MNRRNFLSLSVLGVLASCQVGPSRSDNAVATSFKLSSPTAASPSWSVLAKSLQGKLVRPDSPQYATAHQLFNPRFDGVLPAAIAYCVSPADVQSCLAFAHRFGLPLALRAGGHSYGGYSTTTGLVLDVTHMNTVTVDTSTSIATVGAGAQLIDVYATLAQYGLVLSAGSCPTVGIAGLTLGGGVGVLGRKFGLTCDNLLASQVVVANGRVLTCDASHYPDLFWALRGGGGGNFGVVTSFTFQAHPVATLSLFTLDWPWSSAVSVVNAWQVWALQVPDELWSTCLLLATSDKNSGPVVRVNGVYVGDVTPLSSLLQGLTSQIDAAPTSRYVSGAGLLETMLYEAGCYGKTVAECHLPSQDPQGQVQRDTFSAKSDYFTSALPRVGIDTLMSAITLRQGSSTLGAGGIGLDAYGGAINRVAKDATAFVHRDALFSAQY